MNWKLIIISSLVGAFSSFVLGCLIFFGAPQLSNYNVEDYIAVGVLICAGFASFAAYRRADARKFLHAVIVFAAVWILCAAAVIILVLFFVFVVCNLISCKISPFL
ncbi:MAG: hypothetical protein M3Q99_10350 [Acidobacteriota bacterium]|nr:hypothetical protein [Acidobacteriota bacterium]